MQYSFMEINMEIYRFDGNCTLLFQVMSKVSLN